MEEGEGRERWRRKKKAQRRREKRRKREREREGKQKERLEYFRIIIFILAAEGMEYLKTCEGIAIRSHSSYSSQHT